MAQEKMTAQVAQSLRHMLSTGFVHLEAGAFDRVGMDVVALRAAMDI